MVWDSWDGVSVRYPTEGEDRVVPFDYPKEVIIYIEVRFFARSDGFALFADVCNAWHAA